tara:strand:+ start:112 stop:459 length:348 start_codon:yes stop_codon:yes gene_type:complete
VVGTECLFCDIGNGKIQADFVCRMKDCFVIKDINPVAPIHFLVIPFAHLTYVDEFIRGDYEIVSSMFGAATESAKKAGILDSGYRLVINQKGHAGQQIEHLHLHVMGGAQLGTMA